MSHFQTNNHPYAAHGNFQQRSYQTLPHQSSSPPLSPPVNAGRRPSLAASSVASFSSLEQSAPSCSSSRSGQYAPSITIVSSPPPPSYLDPAPHQTQRALFFPPPPAMALPPAPLMPLPPSPPASANVQTIPPPTSFYNAEFPPVPPPRDSSRKIVRSKSERVTRLVPLAPVSPELPKQPTSSHTTAGTTSTPVGTSNVASLDDDMNPLDLMDMLEDLLAGPPKVHRRTRSNNVPRVTPNIDPRISSYSQGAISTLSTSPTLTNASLPSSNNSDGSLLRRQNFDQMQSIMRVMEFSRSQEVVYTPTKEPGWFMPVGPPQMTHMNPRHPMVREEVIDLKPHYVPGDMQVGTEDQRIMYTDPRRHLTNQKKKRMDQFNLFSDFGRGKTEPDSNNASSYYRNLSDSVKKNLF
ncbi:hypothetical protein HK096_006990 [Nowakowskiella sp. JEL0078]|nr:hypothetical protein HK096_006990 [Nowakowskiella sp. JEL0078]